MSRATEGTPADHQPNAEHLPGALAILAATALGGVIGSRFGKAPLALAAGAATLAWLNPKKGAVEPPTPRRLPEHEPEPEVQHAPTQITEWLARQMDREAQAAVVPLPAEFADSEPPDDYIPQPLIMDEMVPAEPLRDPFVQPTKPPRSHPQPSPFTFEPKSELPLLQSFEPPAAAGAAWLLGVEPLPSLGEDADAPLWLPTSESPPEPVSMVFDGGALPDEIEVPPAVEPVLHLTPAFPWQAALPGPEAPASPPVEEIVQEIPVSLAVPGDASFDPPLAAAPHSPWQPETSPPVVPVVAEPSIGPIIDAEIILRPRTAMPNSVVPRDQSVQPRFRSKKPLISASPESEATLSASPALHSLEESTPRQVWCSWWRGD